MPENSASSALIRAAIRTVQPFVRRLLTAGVPYGSFEEALRRLYVEVAEREFPHRPRRVSDSRVALLTGLNRKVVRRIRSGDPDQGAPQTFRRNLGAAIVSHWLSDADLVDDSGDARPLRYQAAGEAPSFVRLAQTVTSDLPPRAILDELVRTGVVELDAEDVVRLRGDGYLPLQGETERIRMVAEDPAELVETMLHNVFDGAPLHFQQKVAYDAIGQKGLDTLRDELRAEASAFLRKLDRVFARYDLDRNPEAPGGKRRYAGVGLYYFEDAPPAADAEKKSPDAEAAVPPGKNAARS